MQLGKEKVRHGLLEIDVLKHCNDHKNWYFGR